MLCKPCGFHGGDYEESRLLGYRNPVNTSEVTHYVSATESSRLVLGRFVVFTAVAMKNTVFWDVSPRGSCKNRRFGRWKRYVPPKRRFLRKRHSLLLVLYFIVQNSHPCKPNKIVVGLVYSSTR
jgi:hypothetical protein